MCPFCEIDQVQGREGGQPLRWPEKLLELGRALKCKNTKIILLDEIGAGSIVRCLVQDFLTRSCFEQGAGADILPDSSTIRTIVSKLCERGHRHGARNVC